MKSRVRQRSPSILGLCVDGRHLHGLVLRRSNGHFTVQTRFTTVLALDPLTNDPQLVGREIRNRLNDAGIRTRRCVVGLPLHWALTLMVPVPAIGEADESSYLALQAERGFPCPAEDLSIATSTHATPGGARRALIVGIPHNHLGLLTQAFHAARLRPVSLALTSVAAARCAAADGTGTVTVVADGRGIDLLVSVGGGVVALRSLARVAEPDQPQSVDDVDAVARQIRITLGQMPEDLRATVRRLVLAGDASQVVPLVDVLREAAEGLGLVFERESEREADSAEATVSGDHGAAVERLATDHLRGLAPAFEFLPPRADSWTRISARFSSRRVYWLSSAAAGLVGLGLVAVIAQGWRAGRLEQRWNAIASPVLMAEQVQQNVRKFRSWYDASARELKILQRLTESFPEDGAVTAKTVDIKDTGVVICTGTAQDQQALLGVLDRLREVAQVTQLNVEQVRGKSPLQFTFSFRWAEGGRET